jgi:predicted nucleic acid-binding protein
VTLKPFERIAADSNVVLSAAVAPAAARVFQRAKGLEIVTVGRRAPKDIPLAALALKLEIPIWSNDRDFEELPLITYPTARLLKILGL